MRRQAADEDRRRQDRDGRSHGGEVGQATSSYMPYASHLGRTAHRAEALYRSNEDKIEFLFYTHL